MKKTFTICGCFLLRESGKEDRKPLSIQSHVNPATSAMQNRHPHDNQIPYRKTPQKQQNAVLGFFSQNNGAKDLPLLGSILILRPHV